MKAPLIRLGIRGSNLIAENWLAAMIRDFQFRAPRVCAMIPSTMI